MVCGGFFLVFLPKLLWAAFGAADSISFYEKNVFLQSSTIALVRFPILMYKIRNLSQPPSIKTVCFSTLSGFCGVLR